MSLGKLSPLNDMLHNFVALEGKLWQENGECLLFLLTPCFQNLLMQVDRERVRSAESLGSCALLLGRKWQPTPVFLPGESQGWGSLVGFRFSGHTESDTTEAT